MLFPNTFTTLQRVVYEENKIELLKKYLNNDWYNEDCGCYEAHKSKQNIYYGYWSFEAGAIAKILKINDTQLRDTQYYPYDMVHYKEQYFCLCLWRTDRTYFVRSGTILLDQKKSNRVFQKISFVMMLLRGQACRWGTG